MISTIQVDMEQLVYAFHKKYGHLINTKPVIPDDDTIELRVRLIEEEINELADAIDDNDLVEIADALGDCLVVLLGTAISYGIPIQNVFLEVHNSNMSKSLEKNEYGKTLKGENFREPDIKGILKLTDKNYSIERLEDDLTKKAQEFNTIDKEKK